MPPLTPHYRPNAHGDQAGSDANNGSNNTAGYQRNDDPTQSDQRDFQQPIGLVGASDEDAMVAHANGAPAPDPLFDLLARADQPVGERVVIALTRLSALVEKSAHHMATTTTVRTRGDARALAQTHSPALGLARALREFVEAVHLNYVCIPRSQYARIRDVVYLLANAPAGTALTWEANRPTLRALIDTGRALCDDFGWTEPWQHGNWSGHWPAPDDKLPG